MVRKHNPDDCVSVYRRLMKARNEGKGVRLSLREVVSILCDGAVRQAVETADEDERMENERAES